MQGELHGCGKISGYHDRVIGMSQSSDRFCGKSYPVVPRSLYSFGSLIPVVGKGTQIEVVGQLFLSGSKVEVFFRFINAVHPRRLILFVRVSPILWLNGVGLRIDGIIKSECHTQIAVSSFQVRVQVLIRKIEGISNIDEPMIVFINWKVLRKIKGQVFQP